MATDVTLSAAAAAGLLSFLSPCVLPLVPPYLTFIAGTTIEDVAYETRSPARGATFFLPPPLCSRLFDGFRGAWRDGLVLRPGSARAYRHACRFSPAWRSFCMGLHFLGLSGIGLLYREKRFEVAKPLGLWGAYVMGLAFAFGWTPCIGPILAAILAIAASEETVGARRRPAGRLFARPRHSLSLGRRCARTLPWISEEIPRAFSACRANRRRSCSSLPASPF